IVVLRRRFAQRSGDGLTLLVRGGNGGQLGAGGGDVLRRGRAAAAVAPLACRCAGADVDAVSRHLNGSNLGLRRLVNHERLTLGIEAIDETILITAGVDLAIRTNRDTEDMILLRRE